MSNSTQEPEPHHRHRAYLNANTRTISNINTKLANPLRGIPYETLMNDVEEFARHRNLLDLLPELQEGVFMAQDPGADRQRTSVSTANEREFLRSKSIWFSTMPPMLFLAAFAIGMGEAAINGAQLSYPKQFGIDASTSRGSWLLGLINAAPYLCRATVSCWLTDPLHQWLGWKKTTFVAYFISSVGCMWSAVTNTWWHLLLARFFLGFGIGPGAATTLFYSYGTIGTHLPDLPLLAQNGMASGRVCGDIVALAFHFIPNSGGIKGLNWRLTLVPASVPGLIICLLVFILPESPRWLFAKERYRDAFNELCRFHDSKVEAARELYYFHVLLEAEEAVNKGRNRLLETFSIPRNRRAVIASWIIMFGQQFCGINVIICYSSIIFSQSGFSDAGALAATLGFGALNWIAGWPACCVFDKIRRRNLLLFTFPCMAACLLITSFSFWDTLMQGRLAGVAIGIYLFPIFYSLGEVSAPLLYSAEAFPLYILDIGISFAVATGWFWKFVSSATWPFLLLVFKPQGAFAWYAVWCMIFWVLILLFVRETKDKTPEEVHQAFSVPTRVHVAYALRHAIEKFIPLQNTTPEELCQPRPNSEDTSGVGDGVMKELHQNTAVEP